MTKEFCTVTPVLFIAALFASAAAAQAPPDPRTVILLDRLQELSQPTSDSRARVFRDFAVKVTANIVVRSSPPPPHDVLCEVTLFHSTAAGGSYFETKAQKYVVPATGRSFKCEITLNARWQRADNTRNVTVTVAIRPMTRDLAFLPNQQEFERNVSFFESIPPIPLPVTGSTTLIQTIGAI